MATATVVLNKNAFRVRLTTFGFETKNVKDLKGAVLLVQLNTSANYYRGVTSVTK